MKKLKLFVLFVLFGFVLVSCFGGPNSVDLKVTICDEETMTKKDCKTFQVEGETDGSILPF